MPTSALQLAALLLSVAQLTLSQSGTIAPGAACTGVFAYCAGGPIILRCGTGNTLEPGNCADNLNEPTGGATCIDPATSTGTGGFAQCSAVGVTATTTSPPVYPTTTSTNSFPLSLSGTCSGTAAQCAGGPIIFRCESSTVVPGNCNDNLGEPPYGANCAGSYPTASCTANPSYITPTSSTPVPISTTPTSITSSTPNPISTTSTPITSSTSTATYIGPGAACSGSYTTCAGGPIILRCENGVLVAGNCADNLGEPPYGALCVGTAPNASCSANPNPTSTSTTTSTSTPISTSTDYSSPSSSSSSSSSPAIPLSSSLPPATTSNSGTDTATSTTSGIGITVTPYTGAATPGAQLPALTSGWLMYASGLVVAMVFGAAMLVV